MTHTNFELYQVNLNSECKSIAFLGYDMISTFDKDNYIHVSNYDKVATGSVLSGFAVEDSLEYIFANFNYGRKRDFRSMSVSDVVVLYDVHDDGMKIMQAYYCDSTGFKSIDTVKFFEERLNEKD